MRTMMMAAVLVALAGPSVAQDGNAAAGQRVFNQCRACHTADSGGRNTVGPNLFGVVGRHAGSIEGFRYSANMRELGAGGLVWSDDQLRAYVRNPKAVAPRGSMSYPGLRNDTQINDLMAYLATLR